MHHYLLQLLLCVSYEYLAHHHRHLVLLLGAQAQLLFSLLNFRYRALKELPEDNVAGFLIGGVPSVKIVVRVLYRKVLYRPASMTNSN
mmetsp:Transcript_1854/g.2992  ORF Transcript_1854/g.2992 Transcript_1854/m.2992 type:complete len:88 (+) Transcript_1854:428-691(+)